MARGSSPHTRGARALSGCCISNPGIIPAYAGSTRRRRRPIWRRTDHPRIRGEHFFSRPGGFPYAGSSPHTRGARSRHPWSLPSGRIIPAYAGSTAVGWRRRRRPADHPRIRGEHRRHILRLRGRRGSSPHTRGALANTSKTKRGGPDHPRIRGEHAGARAYTPSHPGSSPHTRGARVGFVGDHPLLRIIPAYAGSTVGDTVAKRERRDHPRIRGEHIYSNLKVPEQAGSSPHTRGARDEAGEGPVGPWIIPAYAGSTDQMVVAELEPLGSSPHTRGAPPREAWRTRSEGIIPAYAGSTFRQRILVRARHGSSPHTRGARDSR